MGDMQGKPSYDSHWHLDKRVSVGHILTTLSVAVGVIYYAATLETRLAELAGADKVHDAKIEAIVQAQTRGQEMLTRRLDRMEGKLDRLIESR